MFIEFLNRVVNVILVIETLIRQLIKSRALAFAIVLLIPQALDFVDSRGIAQKAINIVVEQNSLAMSAILDMRADFETTKDLDEQMISLNWGQITLNAGVDGTEVLEIIHPKVKSQVPTNNAPLFDEKLHGLRISQDSHQQIPTLAELKNIRSIDQIDVRNTYGDLMPMKVRKAQLLAAAQPEDLKQPQWKDKAQALVEQALLDKKASQVRRVIESQTGSQIIVSRTDYQPRQGSSKEKSKQTEEELEKQTESGSNGLVPTQWKDHHERPLVISGKMTFSKGLAYTGNNLLSISRVYEGETKETAKIWIRDARYEIPVDQAKGYLIAEMHDNSGLLIAYEEYDLSKLPTIQKNQYKYSDLNIQLEPVKQGAIVRVISGYSYEDKIIDIQDPIVTLEPFGSEMIEDEEGQFVERSLEKGSDIVVKVEAKDHWPTLSRVTSGTVATVRSFHNSMVSAFIDIVSLNAMERKQNRQKGIIWGTVTNAGKPIAGAKVEVSGKSESLSYINKLYLPDVSMQLTSENGMFAIVGAEEGIHSLRVTYLGQQYPAQVVKTLNHHVSFIEINFDELQSVRLKVADAFDDQIPVNVAIRSLGLDTYIDQVSSAQDINSQKFPLSYQMYEADAGLSYEMIRVEEPLSQHFIRFPLVQRNWLRGIKANYKISDAPETGIVFGWVSEDGFDVFLDDGKSFGDLRYIYFNQLGQVVEKDQSPKGFIIYNVPVGQHTVTIVPHSRKTVITKVVTIDTEFVSTIYR